MKFTDLTIDKFNNIYGIETDKLMNIDEFTDYIETNGVDYMYASYDSKDVEEEYKDFLKDTQIECDLVCINDSSAEVNGLYLAIYN